MNAVLFVQHCGPQQKNPFTTVDDDPNELPKDAYIHLFNTHKHTQEVKAILNIPSGVGVGLFC